MPPLEKAPESTRQRSYPFGYLMATRRTTELITIGCSTEFAADKAYSKDTKAGLESARMPKEQ